MRGWTQGTGRTGRERQRPETAAVEHAGASRGQERGFVPPGRTGTYEISLAGGKIEQHARNDQVVRVQPLVRRVRVGRDRKKRLRVVDCQQNRAAAVDTWDESEPPHVQRA